jgi:hypothetical protein
MPLTTTSQIENARSLNDEIIRSIDLLSLKGIICALSQIKPLKRIIKEYGDEKRRTCQGQSARLEVARQIDVAMARAQAFNESDEDDLESVASEIKNGRVQGYIRQQDPENHIVDNDNLVAPVSDHNEPSTHKSLPLNHFAQPSVLDIVIRHPLSHTVPPGFPDDTPHLNQTIRYEIPNTIGCLPQLQSLYKSTPE